MRALLIQLFLSVPFIVCLNAQVPNGGFESWTGPEPDDWISNNLSPLDTYPITQTTDAHSGSFAVRGEVLPPILGSPDPYIPVLTTQEIAIDSEPEAVGGWYTLETSSSASRLTVVVAIYDAQDEVTGVGGGASYATSSFTEFNFPIDYTYGTGGESEYAIISLILNADTDFPDVGDFFIADDLSFSGAVGIDEHLPESISIESVYPQPCHGRCNTGLFLDEGQHIRMEVIDMVGRQVELVFEGYLPPGDRAITWRPSTDLPEGAYLLRLIGKDGIHTERLIVAGH